MSRNCPVNISKQNEFGMHRFRYAARAIKSNEFILRGGTFEFERISDGFRNQGNVRPRIYKQRNVGLSFGRWGLAKLRVDDGRGRRKEPVVVCGHLTIPSPPL